MIALARPSIEAADCEEVCRVLLGGQLVQARVVESFERALAAYTGAAHVAAVSSGTAALWVALRALGVGPGQAVIAPAFTFPATVNAIELLGARPVLVDVEPATYCMDPEQVARAVRRSRGPERLAAIVPVHEFGAPCAMDEILAAARDAGLAVVEDAACALGTTFRGRQVGTLGEAGCFSFHPRKAITTGEGGAVATQDPGTHERVAQLRNHGLTRHADGGFDVQMPGLNWRMTEFQAALGLAQLGRFDGLLQARARLARRYLERLRSIEGLGLPAPVEGHAWQTLMVVLPEGIPRNRVIARLRERGIETTIGAYGIHMLSYYRQRYGYRPADFPVAARLHERGLALPLHAALSEDEVDIVAGALAEVLRA